jgi:hypothetical protein
VALQISDVCGTDSSKATSGEAAPITKPVIRINPPWVQIKAPSVRPHSRAPGTDHAGAHRSGQPHDCIKIGTVSHFLINIRNITYSLQNKCIINDIVLIRIFLCLLGGNCAYTGAG